MVEIVQDIIKIDNEVEVATTWGFPESIDPATVLFFGDTDFALTLESDAKTKKSVLCKAKQHKVVHTLGNSLDSACFNKIERFYPKPDYKDILVHESGKPKKKNPIFNGSSKSGCEGTPKSKAEKPFQSAGPDSFVKKKSEKFDGLPKRSDPKQLTESEDSAKKKVEKLEQSNSTVSCETKPVSDREETQSVTSSSSVITKQSLVSAPSSPTKQPTTLPPTPSPHPPESPASTKETTPATTYEDLGLTDSSGAYPCNNCSRTFATLIEMSRHCSDDHGIKKAFKCKICSKCFHNSRGLLLHTFIHTGEKHYKCLHCPLTFRQPGHRNDHMKKAHADELPYKCEHCDKAFKRRLFLTNHVKEEHSVQKVKCNSCLVSFTNASQLKHHICTKRERKFKCGSCGEKFLKMANVMHHAKFCKYVDQSEMTCEKCGSVFPSAAKCSVHKTYLCTGELITPKLEPLETDSPAADSSVADSSVADSLVADSLVADSSVADSFEQKTITESKELKSPIDTADEITDLSKSAAKKFKKRKKVCIIEEQVTDGIEEELMEWK